MSDDTSTAAHIEVIAGGEATPEELAALIVALTPVVHEGDVEVGPSRTAVPPWTRAALLEGTGRAATVRTPAELRAR